MNIRQIESNLYIAVACLMAATGMTKKEFTTVAGTVSEETEQFILNKAACGTLTKDDITRYTRRVGKEIADVYGWKVRN